MRLDIPLYQIDAFTKRPFHGNPAAVCPLERWVSDDILQAVAAENNLAETAFFVPEDGHFRLRWFTPTTEVRLCGHATLASAHVILNVLHPGQDEVQFQTLSGELTVRRDGERFSLDFPALPLQRRHDPAQIADALGVKPLELWEADRAMAVLQDAAAVETLRPDIAAIEKLPFGSVIVTAQGAPGDADFVSRYFTPKQGVPEDPVTGSAHCVLTPYWSKRLGKPELFARQVSARGGELWLLDRGDRVTLSGYCTPVIEGRFRVELPDESVSTQSSRR